MPHLIGIQAITFGALLAIAQAGAQAQPRPGPTWEYREIQLSTTAPSQPVMNRLGAEGWELVTVVHACTPLLSDNTAVRCEWWAYFKRRTS